MPIPGSSGSVPTSSPGRQVSFNIPTSGISASVSSVSSVVPASSSVGSLGTGTGGSYSYTPSSRATIESGLGFTPRGSGSVSGTGGGVPKVPTLSSVIKASDWTTNKQIKVTLLEESCNTAEFTARELNLNDI